LETFALHSLHLCQRLYDPYQNWARRIAGDAVSAMERSRQRFKAAPLINEFVPFFYHNLSEYTHLPGKLTDQLLHLFGAVIAGNQRNALQAISPATLEVLMRLLVDPAMAESSGSVARGRLGLTLKCLTEMVQALHTGSPDQRQVEVASVLDGYFKVLNAEGVAMPGSLAWNDGLVELQMHMLRSIPEMLACSDRPVLQASFLNSNCFEHLTRLLHNSKLLLSARAKAPGKSEKELANNLLMPAQGPGKHTDALTVLTIRVLTCVMHTSPAAKEVFKERIGYNHLFDLLQSLGQPSLALLYELLDMAVEGDHRQALSGASRMYGGGGGGVANVQALLMLVRWLPMLESLSARSYLAAALHQLCCADRPSRTVCVNAGMMSCILDSLQMVDPVRHMDCAVSLVGLLEALGSQSIRAKELFCLFRLLRIHASSPTESAFSSDVQAAHPLTGTVTRALSAMARRDGVERAMHYFDLTHAMAGITVPAVQRWPGSGFSFHAWFCLDATEQRLAHLAGGKRKQLYSFFTSSGTGFEAFVTGAGVLVVAVCTKKEYVTVSLPDTCFHDSAWHCVAVVHTTARRALFSQCIVNIYVNGQLRDTAPLKFPPMGEAFTSCCIGSAGNRTITPTPSQIPEPTSFFPGSPPHSSSSTSFSTSPSSHGVTAIPSPISASSSSVLAGTQDSEWGSPTSLRGQLGSVSVFHDALQPPQVKALYQAGPNNLFPFKPPECAPELTDLPAKMLLYYTPKACQKLLCLDLAPSHLFDGRLTGQTVVNWDIKDVIHCMGGMAVLVPLLEQLVSTECPAAQQDDGGAFSSPARTSVKLQLGVDTNHNDQARLEGSHVACFLLLLRNFVRNHPANQESLAQSQGMATVGALILQSGKRHMDASVLTACQLLVEAVIDSNALLLHQVYQALLFDFRLWSQADFPVRIGHIQYLSTIIKDNHKQFRRRYGVQFLLDVVRTYYGSRSSELCADDLRVIRAAIFGLIKYYITKEVSSDEVQSIINFLASVGEEEQINACLDMLLALLRSKGPSPSYEQLVLLLTEAGQCEGLYSLLLLQRKHSDVLREKLFRLFLRLLRSERIGEKSKQRLRLRDGLFAGLVALQADMPVTLTVVRGMLLIIVTADTSPNYQDIMAVVHFSRKADLSVRHAVCKKVFDLVYNSHDAIQQIARCTGWQDTLVRLLAWESNPNAQAMDTASPTDATPPLGAAVIPPHTPFRDSPFDLTLDSPLPEGACAHGAPQGSRGSFGAGAPAAGGGGGSGSVPSTPSPLDTWKPFPGSVSRQESSLSDAFDESLLNEEFFSNVEQSVVPPPQVPVEEDLCDLLVSVLFSAMWHGVEGSDETAWRERGQVFTALTKLGSRCLLLRPPSHIKRCLLELMLEACVSDVRDAALASLPGLADNALRLLRLVQDHLITEGQACPEFWSLKVMEGLVTLLDTLSGRQASLGTPLDLSETTHISQRLLLGFIAHSDTQVCATAAAKLHTLLQTRPLSGREEAGYLLGRLDDALSRSAPEHGARHRAAFDTHSFVVPMLHALLERCHKLLALAQHLPGLPVPNGSPTCLDDFQVYCRSTEWRLFVDIVVLPLMNQFEMERFAKGHDRMSCFWNSCFDALMGSSCRRDHLRNESQRKFQDQVVEPFRRRTRGERERFNNSLKAQAAEKEAKLSWSLRAHSKPQVTLVGVPADSLSLGVVLEAKVDEVDEDKLEDEEEIAPVAPTRRSTDRLVVLSRVLLRLPPPASGTGEGEQSQKEKLVLAEECQLIKMVDAVPGRLELTTHHVYFYDLSGDKEEGAAPGMGLDFKCPLWQLREVHLRRYNLRRSALEIFFIDQTSYFLNFTKEISCSLYYGTGWYDLPDVHGVYHTTHLHVRNRVYSRIVGLRPPNLVYYGSRSPQELLKASGITQKWVNREISNFEYLMKLNTIAGRTYNDLAQYPVFPWVLSDYTSDELDLSNPGVFRDLSKPIGIVSERNAKEVKDRYENFEDTTGTTGKFHYGTHYSNAAGVMHYMIRVEPLTTLHIQLQSGRFDCADRQFHSIPATWQALMDSPNDVKELIPEFFYFPEFLENQNGFDLGTLQMSRETVNNVVLPRWAKSPDDFIRKHRAALESEFVSAHLHEWIDLIFGYKQRGPAAVEAHNVFYYCTYEG
uniref:Neurobeachin like 2 n=1 Tax=Petromyzon marinus TaxID=7757 RepID=S4R477_PETMA